MNRRSFLQSIGGAGVLLRSKLLASCLVPQTPLPGKSIPKFVDPLPVFGPAGPIPRVAGPNITVGMYEFPQQVLPAGYPQTLVWGYQVGGSPALYPGVTIEAQRYIPATVTYVNNLPVSPQLRPYLTVDQTIHWANPLGLAMDDPARGNPYAGPSPTVAHLHGAEVQSEYDGGPDQWFTPTGLHGPGYRTYAAAAPNAAVYHYPNGQEATTLWFHDHTLGITRLNVYSGFAAFYLLRDEYDTGVPGSGLNLPAGPWEIELVLQDRQFDTAGQWLFPDGHPAGLNGPPPNPDVHPYWIPEFFGDAMVVNGKTWPYLNVEPRRYRFRFLNGSNARFYELRLEELAASKPGPAFWVIGSDGGLLDAPVKLNDPDAPGGNAPRLFMAPGERFDVIIDFAGSGGKALTLINSAKAPYPGGSPPDPQTSGRIMQFRVVAPLTAADTSFDPASTGAVLRGSGRMPPIIRLANPATGTAAVMPDVTRRLVLKENEGPGGPLEVLVNNTKWDGMIEGTMTPIPGSTPDGHGNFLTELPRVGSTELWEIVNLTEDAHPIHLHLVQFQVVNRQAFQAKAYEKAWNAAFPGGSFGGVTYAPGTYIPGFGPPLPYDSTTPVGGNPDVTPYLQGKAAPPDPEEAGWKDTAKMYPGQVSRIIVRFAPQDVAAGAAVPGTNLYPFDPTTGPGYVWHCHIIDHEDNEMMRPYIPRA